MTRRRLVVLAGSIAAHPLFVAAAAYASETAEHADPHAAGIPFGTLLLSAINLTIFIWGLSRFAMPSVRRFVTSRRTQVVNALAAALAAKTEAERLRAEWERRLAEVEQTIATLRAQARADAERERTRILEAAQKTAETIRRDAERAAAYEIRRTQEQLRIDLVRHALRLAQDSARQSWSAADQDRFVTEFMQQVEK